MKKHLLLIAVASTSLSLNASILFQQSFTPNGGNQPSIDGASVGGSSYTWTASAFANGALRTDGQVFTLASGSAYIDLGNLINISKGTSGGVFTLTTVMDKPSGSNWVSSGFFALPNVTESFVNAGGIATAIYRTNENVDFFAGLGTGNGTGSAFADKKAAGPQTLTSVLDLSGWNGIDNFGSVSFFLNDSFQQTWSLAADYSITAVGISTQGGGGEGVIQSIQLEQTAITQVPEPSTYALIAGLLTFGLVAYRRRRQASAR
jgi:hypothetical protein